MTASLDPSISQQLGVLARDYDLQGELGRGGMAVVYRATERATGRPVALKLLRPDQLGDEEALPRLEREAQLVQRLVHPRIVQLYRFLPLPPLGACLVMQLAPGGTLKQRLQREGALPIDDVRQILVDLVDALSAAHQQGVIHRDLKPDNVYFDHDGRALLGDFGIARAADSDTLTLTGTAIGTPHYMSPEQIDGARVGPAADLYSLGLVGFAMLTGRVPWAGESLYSVIYKQKHEQLPRIATFRPDTPPRMQRLIETCLAKTPEDRPANCGAIVDELVAVDWHEAKRASTQRQSAQSSTNELDKTVRWNAESALDSSNAARVNSFLWIPVSLGVVILAFVFGALRSEDTAEEPIRADSAAAAPSAYPVQAQQQPGATNPPPVTVGTNDQASSRTAASNSVAKSPSVAIGVPKAIERPTVRTLSDDERQDYYVRLGATGIDRGEYSKAYAYVDGDRKISEEDRNWFRERILSACRRDTSGPQGGVCP